MSNHRPLYCRDVDVFSVMVGDPILEAWCDEVSFTFYLCQTPGIADHTRSLSSLAVIVGVVRALRQMILVPFAGNIVGTEVIADPSIPAFGGYLENRKNRARSP